MKGGPHSRSGRFGDKKKSLTPAWNRTSNGHTRRSNLRMAGVFVAAVFEQLKLFSSHTSALVSHPNMPDPFVQVTTRIIQSSTVYISIHIYSHETQQYYN